MKKENKLCINNIESNINNEITFDGITLTSLGNEFTTVPIPSAAIIINKEDIKCINNTRNCSNENIFSKTAELLLCDTLNCIYTI